MAPEPKLHGPALKPPYCLTWSQLSELSSAKMGCECAVMAGRSSEVLLAKGRTRLAEKERHGARRRLARKETDLENAVVLAGEVCSNMVA